MNECYPSIGACPTIIEWNKIPLLSDYCWGCKYYIVWKSERCSSQKNFKFLLIENCQCRYSHSQDAPTISIYLCCSRCYPYTSWTQSTR